MARHLVRLEGNEPLQPASIIGDVTILDFWRWAFSDLQMNDIRGIFAEWLVAKLLDIPLDVRDSWQEWDLITREGVKIEVKTSAYLQAWAQKRPSPLKFSGLKGRKLNGEDNSYAAEATYNADLYVFCVQVENDARRWDALDLSQWQFYVLRKDELESLNQKSLSVGPLARMCPAMDAADFRVKAREEIAAVVVGMDPSRAPTADRLSRVNPA